MKSELLSEYKELTDRISALREQAKEKAKTILKEGMVSYFQKHGHLTECIVWKQFTPYFNDGEACEFRVHEPVVIMKPLVESDEEDEHEYTEDSKYAYSIDDFTVKEIDKRIEVMKVYEADPLTWSKARAMMQNAKIQGSYRYTDDYYITYPPDLYSVEELLRMRERAEQIDESFHADTEAIISFIQSIDDDVMKELFGDHVRIIITAEDTIIEEYYHD